MGRLKVSVQNTTGWGVDSIFYEAGIRYERLDVGDGRNLSVIAKALSHGITPLVLYNAGSGGGLHGVSPSHAAADVVSMARRLNSLAARYPIMNKLRAIEFGNEVYLDENVATYGRQYAAAHQALAAAGLSSWKLLAVGAAYCAYGAQDWIPQLIAAVGAAAVDGWTVHPYGSMNNDQGGCPPGEGFGWPEVLDYHNTAVKAGSNAPWYITEVGQCIRVGNGCSSPVSRWTQATAMTRYLRDTVSKYPWVVFFNWYTSCDDRSGGWGLLDENSAGVCGATGRSSQRPAFKALARWLALNGEG